MFRAHSQGDIKRTTAWVVGDVHASIQPTSRVASCTSTILNQDLGAVSGQNKQALIYYHGLIDKGAFVPPFGQNVVDLANSKVPRTSAPVCIVSLGSCHAEIENAPVSSGVRTLRLTSLSACLAVRWSN